MNLYVDNEDFFSQGFTSSGDYPLTNRKDYPVTSFLLKTFNDFSLLFTPEHKDLLIPVLKIVYLLRSSLF